MLQWLSGDVAPLSQEGPQLLCQLGRPGPQGLRWTRRGRFDFEAEGLLDGSGLVSSILDGRREATGSQLETMGEAEATGAGLRPLPGLY